MSKQHEALCFSTLTHLCIWDNNPLIAQVMTIYHLIFEPQSYDKTFRLENYRG